MNRSEKKLASDLLEITGIGNTFLRDFYRIGITSQTDLLQKSPEVLYKKLIKENEKVSHKTSKNYLYVIRMAVYYANGGREKSKLKWSAWKD